MKGVRQKRVFLELLVRRHAFKTYGVEEACLREFLTWIPV
jgi:hypothetical protein